MNNWLFSLEFVTNKLAVRRALRTALTVFVVCGLAIGVNAADATDSGNATFDIGPSINQALESAIQPVSPPSPAPRIVVPNVGGGSGAVSLVMANATSQTAATDEERKPGKWLVGGFDTTSRWVSAGLMIGLGSYLATQDTDDVRDLGDITQLIPSVAALGVSMGSGDWKGVGQFGLASGTAFTLTHVVKEVVDKSRPDSSANNSFPSGHTAASVSGSAFLWRRYGPKWGVPATVLAAYTGLSRVEGQKHFMDDVLSGAAIGLISNWLWTDPIDDRVQMAMFPTKGGAGLSMTVDTTGKKEQPQKNQWSETLPEWMFTWEIGGSNVTRNDVRSPNSGGTTVDFRFGEENDPTTTAFLALTWGPKRSKFSYFGGFAPFEIREVLDVPDDLFFAGKEVPNDITVQSQYVAYDYRFGVDYAIFDSPKFRLGAGGALAFFDTEVGLYGENGFEAYQRVTAFRPLLSLGVEMVLTKHWLVFSRLSWWSDSEFTIADFSAQVAYRLNPKWALSFGYRYVDRKVDVPELYNKVQRNQLALGIYYMW